MNMPEFSQFYPDDHPHVDEIETKFVRMQGMKFDGDKLQWDLLPLKEVEQVVKVLMKGAKKYKPDNWKYVDNAKQRYLNAAIRHVVARAKGEIVDPEFDLPHTAHAICCLLFLMWFDKDKE